MKAIVLVITPTMALMKDQAILIQAQGISAIAFMAKNVQNNYNICKEVETRVYLVVLASPKMVLEPHSLF